MGKSSPSLPPAPDYRGAALAQGDANVNAARVGARLSNPNVYSPYGNQTVAWDDVAPKFNQDAFNAVNTAYNTQLNDYFIRQRNAADDERIGEAPIAPKYADFMIPGTLGDQPTITQTLTPQAQGTLEAQQRVQTALAGLGEQGIGTAKNILATPFSFKGPGVQTSIANANVSGAPVLSQFGQAGADTNAGRDIQNYLDPFSYGTASSTKNAGQNIQVSPNLFSFGQAGANAQQGGIQNRIDTSGIANMPVNAGMTAQQAIMSRLNPSIAQNRVSTETQLINQGLRPGGEAYNNAINLLGQQENDQRTQAALQGINLDVAANQQGFGQAAQQAQFGNAAQGQGFAQQVGVQGMQNQAVAQNQAAAAQQQQLINAAQAQTFGQLSTQQGMGNQAVAQNQAAAFQQQQAQNAAQQQIYQQLSGQAGLRNQAIAQNQQTGLAQQQAQNAAAAQQFNQNLQGAQFSNTSQQQALAQALQGRQLPLNEINALMSGSQIQNPQFQQYQGQNVAPPPLAQAAAQQAAYGQNIYNQQMGQANATTSGLFNLGGSSAMAYAAYVF